MRMDQSAHVVENRRGVCSEWREKLRRGRDDYARGRRTKWRLKESRVEPSESKAGEAAEQATHIR